MSSSKYDSDSNKDNIELFKIGYNYQKKKNRFIYFYNYLLYGLAIVFNVKFNVNYALDILKKLSVKIFNFINHFTKCESKI